MAGDVEHSQLDCSSMPLNLNFFVNQSRYGITRDNNVNFGTDGLGTCVGVIVRLNNGTNFCGHMDHSYEPTQAQKAQFILDVRTLLRTTIPLANVQEVYYCTPGGSKAAQYSVDAIRAQFSNAQNAGAQGCIYIGVNGVSTTNQKVVFGQNIDDGAFGV